MHRHIEKFMFYLETEKGYSGHTVLNYRLDLVEFAKFIGDTDVTAIEYLHFRQAQTVRRHLLFDRTMDRCK